MRGMSMVKELSRSKRGWVEGDQVREIRWVRGARTGRVMVQSGHTR